MNDLIDDMAEIRCDYSFFQMLKPYSQVWVLGLVRLQKGFQRLTLNFLPFLFHSSPPFLPSSRLPFPRERKASGVSYPEIRCEEGGVYEHFSWVVFLWAALAESHFSVAGPMDWRERAVGIEEVIRDSYSACARDGRPRTRKRGRSYEMWERMQMLFWHEWVEGVEERKEAHLA